MLQYISFYLAHILYELKRYDEALDECLYSIDILEKYPYMISSDNRGVYNLLGDIYKVKGDIKKAHNCYNDYLKGKTYHPNMYAEMKVLLEYIDKELIDMLPHNIRFNVIYSSSRLYETHIDPDVDLNDQQLLEDTDNLLTYFYSHYFINEDEMKDYFDLLVEYDQDGEEYKKSYEEYNSFIIP